MEKKEIFQKLLEINPCIPIEELEEWYSKALTHKNQCESMGISTDIYAILKGHFIIGPYVEQRHREQEKRERFLDE